MKYCSEGDLETLIKKRFREEGKISEKEVLKVLVHGIRGLKAMHTLKFIHRDIKPANILIDELGVYVISDFGAAKTIKELVTTTMVGSLGYVSPEMLDQQPYSFSTDVFSLGVTLYEMMVGKNPFAYLKERLSSSYTPVNPNDGYSSELIGLVHAFMAMDPSERPTAAAALANPFVQQAITSEKMETLQVRLASFAQKLEELEREKAEMGTKVRLIEERAQRGEAALARLEKDMADCTGLVRIAVVLAPQPSMASVTYTDTLVRFPRGSNHGGNNPEERTVVVEHDLSLDAGKTYLLDLAVTGLITVGLALLFT